MTEAPSFKSFLLRSLVMWLTVFCLMFFSWAWWDSERYRTTINFMLGSSFEFALWIGDGGLSLSLWETPYGPVNRLIFDRNPMYPFSGKQTPMDYWSPQTNFSTLLLLTIVLSILWHTWRWRVICKHFQAPSQSNGFS